MPSSLDILNYGAVITKSISYKLDRDEVGEENAGAEVTCFASGRMNGHIYYRGVDIRFSQVEPSEIEAAATLMVFALERIAEEQ